MLSKYQNLHCSFVDFFAGSLNNAPHDPLPLIPSMDVLPKVETAATVGPFIKTEMKGEAKAKCLEV